MSELPRIKYSKDFRKGYITQFGGINRLSLSAEGAMYDAINMSAVNFPALSTRLGFAGVPIKDIDEKVYGMASLNGDAFVIIGTTKIWFYSYLTGKWRMKPLGMTISENQNVFVYNKEKKISNKTYKYGIYMFMPSMCAFVHWTEFNKNGTKTGENFFVGNVKEEITVTKDTAVGDAFLHVLPGFHYTLTAKSSVDTGVGTYLITGTMDGEVYKISITSTKETVSLFGTYNGTDGKEESVAKTFAVPITNTDSYTLKPKINVKLDNAFIHSNRVWGYNGKTIYASSLGIGLDFDVDGTDAGGWSVETLLQEDITAGCSFGGHPVFFTENHILTVYGDYPSEYAITTYDVPGVAAECTQSLAKSGAKLYYLSEAGVMRYSGGMPIKISDPLTMDLLTNGKGAADQENYYLWAEKKDKDTMSGLLYVYNIPTQTWNIIQYGGGVPGSEQRDSTEITSPVLVYISNKDPSVNEVMLFDNGAKKMYCVPYQSRQTLFPGAITPETYEGYNHSCKWAARFGRFFIQSPNMKGILQIQLRARLTSFPTEYDGKTGAYCSTLKVKICYDDDDADINLRDIFDDTGFHTIHAESVRMQTGEHNNDIYKLRNIFIPVNRRCDSFKLEISGDGRWEIASLSIEYNIGTERR